MSSRYFKGRGHYTHKTKADVANLMVIDDGGSGRHLKNTNEVQGQLWPDYYEADRWKKMRYLMNLERLERIVSPLGERYALKFCGSEERLSKRRWRKMFRRCDDNPLIGKLRHCMSEGRWKRR